MSLKTRFLLLAAALMVLASLASWLVFESISQRVIEGWGRRMAQVQVRYDSARLLQPLEREIALARQMAQSNVLRRWASEAQPTPELHAEALAEMESYRRNFMDRNYFFARVDNGDYYHNNAQNEYATQPLRYRLHPGQPADVWFYQLVRERRDFHLNINPDEVLDVTKLWIDMLVRDGERVVGVLGTGIELGAFLHSVVDIGQPGITSLFVDQHGAIQLSREQKLIDFASFVKPEGQKNTLALLLDRPEEQQRVRATMQRLAQLHTSRAGMPEVHTEFVSVRGQRHLLGVAYLPTIGWFEVTLIDLDILMPAHQFWPVLGVFLLMLLLSLLLFHEALRRLILKPVAALEHAMQRLRNGELQPTPLPRAHSEMGRLVAHFDSMADAIRHNTRELEQKVRARTEELDRLARLDALTELHNRRGMQELLGAEAERAQRQHTPYGVLWLDVDEFKGINDRHGHANGDQALLAVAQVLKASCRRYDYVARWGGDEFLVLLAPCDDATLRGMGERIRSGVQAHSSTLGYPLSVTVGGCLSQPGQTPEDVLQCADEALYTAKAQGRNRVCLAGEPQPAP